MRWRAAFDALSLGGATGAKRPAAAPDAHQWLEPGTALENRPCWDAFAAFADFLRTGGTQQIEFIGVVVKRLTKAGSMDPPCSRSSLHRHRADGPERVFEDRYVSVLVAWIRQISDNPTERNRYNPQTGAGRQPGGHLLDPRRGRSTNAGQWLAGVIVRTERGPVSIMAFTGVDARITEIYALLDVDRIGRSLEGEPLRSPTH